MLIDMWMKGQKPGCLHWPCIHMQVQEITGPDEVNRIPMLTLVMLNKLRCHAHF